MKNIRNEGKNTMPFTPKSLKEKPYNACVNCSYLGITCDGPNFLAMTPERWSEWAKLRKDFLGWTNQDVIEKSGMSKATVERAFSSSHDLRLSSMQAITKALINGTWGQYPCAMHADNQDSTELAAQLANAEQQLEDAQRKIDHLLKQTEFDKDQLTEKDKLLTERRDFLHRKDVAIYILSACLGVCILAIIVGLLADLAMPDHGWLLQSLRTGHNAIGMLFKLQ